MAGTSDGILYADNIDFSGSYPVSGMINLNGELFVGSTVAPNIRAHVPIGTNGLVVNTGPGTIDFSLANIPNGALANSTITITPGNGLAGGGGVSLGNSISLSLIASGTSGNVLTSNGTSWTSSTPTTTGTWTPGLSFGGASTGITYATQAGTYVKVGTLVWISARITLTSNGSASGQTRITNLPFTAAASNDGPIFMAMYANITLTAGYTDMIAIPEGGQTTLLCWEIGSAKAIASLPNTIIGGTADFSIQGIFHT
jgi:hypothetical protein